MSPLSSPSSRVRWANSRSITFCAYIAAWVWWEALVPSRRLPANSSRAVTIPIARTASATITSRRVKPPAAESRVWGLQDQLGASLFSFSPFLLFALVLAILHARSSCCLGEDQERGHRRL